MPFIKICGLRSYEEARLALDCGATAFGFLVGLSYATADQISPENAAGIIGKLPENADTVIVTHQTDPEKAAALARITGGHTLQVHGDMPPAGVRKLAALAPDLRLIKAVHVSGPESIEAAAAYAGIAHALLLDTRTVDRLGGTGRTHDWSISARIVAAVPVPVYLAGGLTPENISDAIERVRPAGVDVNSGVKDSAGEKDAEKVSLFVSRAIGAFAPAS
jgi:phosphoribosylanthranilate isomerase